jgi:protein-disulfide isomerase
LKEIRRRYPERVAIIFRYFPLPAHQFATAAALAAECAAKQHAFEAYHNALFSSQELIGHRSWAEYARDAGVSDADAFGACLAASDVLGLVQRDRAAGKKLGVGGTPTLLINDLEVLGYPGPDKLMAMVRSALGTSRRPNN